MLVAAAIAVALLLALKKKPEQQQQQQPNQQPKGTAPNAAAGGSGVDFAKVGTGALGIVGAAIPILKGAGLFSGTGAAAGGSSAAGGGGSGAASSEAAAAAGGAEAAEVGGGLTLLESIGVGAIIVAIEILIAYTWFETDMSNQTRFNYLGKPNLGRLSALWFLDESKTLIAITDPDHPSNPATGQATTCFVNKQNSDCYHYVKNLAWGNTEVDHWTPVDFTLPAAELLRLQRTSRYLAIQKIWAYNQSQFVFFENAYPNNTVDGNNPRGCSDERFWKWVNDMLASEPWAQDCGYKTLATYVQLEATAKAYLGVDFDFIVDRWRFQGWAESLSVSAAVGWAWIGWPGDEQFNRTVMSWSGFGGKPLSETPSGWWGVDAYKVQGNFRWVAVDPVTHWGIDLQASRGQGSKVLYRPELLGFYDFPQPSTLTGKGSVRYSEDS